MCINMSWEELGTTLRSTREWESSSRGHGVQVQLASPLPLGAYNEHWDAMRRSREHRVHTACSGPSVGRHRELTGQP